MQQEMIAAKRDHGRMIADRYHVMVEDAAADEAARLLAGMNYVT